MSTENDVRKIIQSVVASIKRALGASDRSTGQHARPKLESRNGYGSRNGDGRSPRHGEN
jgi:ribosomal protein L19E